MPRVLKSEVKGEPSEAEIKFRTYRGYLECFRELLRREYPGGAADLGVRVYEKTKRLQGWKAADRRVLERFLKIAWNTEFLLSVGDLDEELIRINNQWAPIQCYYAVYGACEVVAYLVEKKYAGSHRKALKQTTRYFHKLGVPPFHLGFQGPLGRNYKDPKPVGFPQDIEYAHNLKRKGVDPVQLVATCLRAEHKHRVEDNWRSSAKRKYEYDPGPTSLLHFLYRLRIKSNYRDLDTFVTDGPLEEVKSFHECLEKLCRASLICAEAVVLRRCGKATYSELADGYLARNSGARELRWRRDFFSSR